MVRLPYVSTEGGMPMLGHVLGARCVSAALFLAIFCIAPAITAAPANSITVQVEGSIKSRPLTVSRVFAQGDIPDCAQAVIGSKPLETQCNVMTRWPDGSVQHVLLSFWLTSPRTTEVSFRNQAEPAGDGELTVSEMLSDQYDFSAVIELDNGIDVLRADARDMLSAGDFRYWLSGPICTQVIIEDRGTGTKHDLGWGEHKPFHPIFVATFYPGWSGVKVEMIGEIAWTTRLKDLSYALTLRVGNGTASRVVYQKPKFTHFAQTRWRKVFWSGEAPPPVNLDLNFAYLIYSKAVPSYDQTKKPSSAKIKNSYDEFMKTDRGDIGGNVTWNKYFPTGGGRPELGLFPSFYVDYLYTFDKRLHEVMLGYAAVSGHIPVHLRESDPDRVYLKGSRPGDAVGRPVSIDSRPTIWAISDWGGTTPRDKITPLAPLADTGWTVDKAHQGSFAYIPYLVTGDWYFLEEIYFWASHAIAEGNGCTEPNGTCRVGSLGSIAPAWQLRGVAWALRNIGHAAFIAPDNSQEKVYFRNKLYNNIAVHEGFHDIKDGSFYRPPYTDDKLSAWNFGRALGLTVGDNPLNFFHASPTTNPGDVDPALVGGVESPWAMSYAYVVIGHLDELGAPVTAWKQRVFANLLDRLTHPDYNPYLVGAYRVPTLTKEYVLFTDWRSVLSAHLPRFQNATGWPEGTGSDNPSDGYPFSALAAASFLPGERSKGSAGQAAWAWINQRVNTSLLVHDRKWAFVPRPASEPAPLEWPIPNASEATSRRSNRSGR
jgi:hypothetical protein